MRIVFSPYFDRGTYRPRVPGKVVLDERAVGTRALLAELELRAGMTRREVPWFTRVVAFYKAVKAVLDAGHRTFFEESFSKDEVGVSGELLRWRDALVMTGWTPDMPASSPVAYKFRDLALIERHFDSPGEADRWWALLQAEGYLKGSSIEVRVPRSSIEKVITDVLTSSGAEVSYAAERTGEGLELGAGLRVLQFRNRSDAYRWISGQDLQDGTLVVNQDNKGLNDVLRAMGRPLVKSEYLDSNPLTIQLFKLGFGLFRECVDVKTLVAYLSAPVNPLPFKCRRELLDLLVRKGGFGEEWNEILREYEVHSPVMADAPNPPGRAALSTVKAFSDELKGWARRYAFLLQKDGKDPDLSSQLLCLCEMCQALDSILEDAPEEFPYEQLERYVDGIYSACSFPDEKAQVGSFDVISDVRGIVEGPRRLVWLDCNAGPSAKYPLFFLSQAEVKYLIDQGLSIVDEETFVRTATVAEKGALKTVGEEIVLAVCRKAKGQRSDEHPILTEIKAEGIPFTLEENPRMPDGEALRVSKLQAPPVEFRLEEGITIPGREHGESYSSVETLIQRPIDYILDYVLMLKEPDMLQLADMRTVKGNVAHAVIEKVALALRDSGTADYSDDELNEIIDQAAVSGGILLYNSKVEYDSFKLKLIQSVRTLLSVILDNGLKVFDCEHYVEVVLPDVTDEDGTVSSIGRFNARIDLLLTDSNDDFVILDLKWSESSRYRNKVREQMDLQLQLYAAAMKAAYPEHKILGAGYYVIPQCVIETHDGYFNGIGHVNYYDVPDDSRADIYSEAVRSYSYRKAQLEAGILEGGEGQELRNIDYLDAAGRLGADLFPLESDWLNEAVKASAYGNKNYILKERAL